MSRQADTPKDTSSIETLSPSFVPTGAPSKWVVLAVIGTVSFMIALSTSVVTIILPILQRSFDSNVAGVEWVVTLYLLVLSGALLGFGRLGDLHGHRSIYVLGILIFATSAGFCGLAPTLEILILFRGIEAVGAAMIGANETGILTKCFPIRQRGQALGLQSTMTYLGLIVGPTLGGWLATHFDWRAVFFINIPLGLLGLIIALRSVPRDPPSQRTEQFNLTSALTFLSGLAVLLLVLNQGYAWGWTSPVVLVLLGIAALILAAFLAINRITQHPILDLELLRDRVFSSSTLTSVLNNVCVSSILFLLPFVLIQGRGFTPVALGVVLSIRAVVMAVVAPLSGSISDRIGTRVPRIIGLVILALATLLLTQLNSQSTINEVGLAIGIVGLGSGIFISANNNALMGAAPPNRRGIAGGVLATARNTGMALGTGLAGAVLATGLMDGQTNAEASIFNAAQLGLLLAAAAAMVGALLAIFWERPAVNRSMGTAVNSPLNPT